MVYSCITCSYEVTNEDAAIRCDTCRLWNHIICNGNLATSVSIDAYNRMIEDGVEKIWHCHPCTLKSNNESVASVFGQIDQIGDIREDNCTPCIPRPTSPHLMFRIITAGLNRGGDMLVDPDNFFYTKKIDRKRNNISRNCRHNKKYKCIAGYSFLHH